MEPDSFSPKRRVISSQTELHPTPHTIFQQINNKMVIVPDKRLLSWYLITLKLRERMYARQKRLAILSPKSGSFKQPQQQQFAPLRALVNRNAEKHGRESHPPEDDNSSLIEHHPSEDDWVITIKQKLGTSSEACKNVSVYRVPAQLKDKSHLHAYTPKVVSLGPYHHGMEPLQKMEQHKWRILHHVLKREAQDIEPYLDSMKELEESVRDCYEEESKLTSNQYVEMMLLDGCFILEVLRGIKFGFQELGYASDDPVFSKGGTMTAIENDMQMLENQLPYFVLDVLDDLQGNVIRNPHGVRRFKDAGLHHLSFVRKSLLCGLPERIMKEDAKFQFLHYSATELRNAGIKFKKGNTDGSLLNIEFKNGILYIPQITIDDKFRSLFFNIIAFEQCHLNYDQQQIASYISFLDDLIDSHEDVRYLKNHGIIEQMLGSDTEVADIINSLCHGVSLVTEGNYFNYLSWTINEYRQQRWNVWRAKLKERYFSNPWAIISLVAAAILLLLTAAQTFYAVYSYYRPKN